MTSTTPLISRELLSSVRDQLLSSAKQHEQEHKETITLSPPLLPRPLTKPTSIIPITPITLITPITSPTHTDPLLDELLGDIRRSCGTSLASTPTAISSDGDKADSVFECRVKRSHTELNSLDMVELRGIVATLSHEADCVSALLVKLLRSRDKNSHRLLKQCNKLSLVLKDFSKQSGLSGDLTFSLSPPVAASNHQPWLNGWKALSRLPKGIPKFWRKILWSELASLGTAELDWDSVTAVALSEFSQPGDEALGSQIVKDLHRTGNTGFSTEQEHAVLKRVLLAYARYNSSTGYCQGFNVLAALILKVVNFDELLALKVMVYLIDYILPENYFAQNLYALSADMAAFRDYLKHFLPELSSHIESLQREASGLVKKAYSSENPPDSQSIHAYEPPLADVFTMQWFLTLFATSLPRKAVRRVWDLVLLEGSAALIHTAVAILAVLERELLQTGTAADFYAVMAQFGEKLRRAQLLPSSEFIQIVYTIQDNATSPNSNIPSISKLREKYTYNICPWAISDEDSPQELSCKKACPPPSCGGSLSLGEVKQQRQLPKTRPVETEEIAATMIDFQNTYSRTGDTLNVQMKVLREHYSHTARQPQSVHCSMSLVPPQARIVCPQTKRAVLSPHNTVLSYGADVPDFVLERGKYLSGYHCIEELQQVKKRVFTINYSQPSTEELMCVGRDQMRGQRLDKRRRSQAREEDCFIRHTIGHLLP